MPYIGASHSQEKYEQLKSKKLGMGSRSSDKVDEAKPDHAQTNEAYPSSVDNRGGKTSATTSFGLSSSEHDIKELLTFPNESTHAYSYNPLSPNSLAVRLRILKRSLEIMIRNPSLLQEHRTNRHLRVETPNGSQKEFKFGTDETISPKKQRQLSRSYSHDGLVPLSTSKLRNASSAALSALVTNTKGHSVADLSLIHISCRHRECLPGHIWLYGLGCILFRKQSFYWKIQEKSSW